VAITCAGRARLEAVERASAIAEERLLGGLTHDQREQLGTLLRLVSETSKLTETCPGSAVAAAGESLPT
jgi:DNA-binding MarR family transcriptional regulator